jgi:hypothetical protein
MSARLIIPGKLGDAGPFNRRPSLVSSADWRRTAAAAIELLVGGGDLEGPDGFNRQHHEGERAIIVPTL